MGTVLGQPKLRGTPARGSNSLLEYLHAQRPTQLYKDLPLTLGYARTLTWAPVPSPRVGRCISPRSKASLLARETVPKGKLWVSSCARTSQGSPVPGHGLWALGSGEGRDLPQDWKAVLSPFLASSHSPWG